MSLLPKSIHRCRRYPTKFNSGRDIPRSDARPANDERGCKREKAEFARSGIQAVLMVVQLPSYAAG